jgi:hypothetical protein
MALINCPECNNEISDKASACPKCGFVLYKKKLEELFKLDNLIIYAGAVGLIIGFFLPFFRLNEYNIYTLFDNLKQINKGNIPFSIIPNKSNHILLIPLFLHAFFPIIPIIIIFTKDKYREIILLISGIFYTMFFMYYFLYFGGSQQITFEYGFYIIGISIVIISSYVIEVIIKKIFKNKK